MNPGRQIARQFASLILMVFMIGSGIAAVLSIGGNTTLALQVCGGSIGVSVLILLAGGYLVAANRPRDE